MTEGFITLPKHIVFYNIACGEVKMVVSFRVAGSARSERS